MNPFHMMVLGSRKVRAVVLRNRSSLSTAAFTLLEIMIVITIVMILAGIAVSRYEKSILRAREISRFTTCQILRQSVVGNKITPQVFTELTHARYFQGDSTDSIALEDVSNLDCGDIDMHMDPIQTIPGMRNLYANSTDKTVGSRGSVER